MKKKLKQNEYNEGDTAAKEPDYKTWTILVLINKSIDDRQIHLLIHSKTKTIYRQVSSGI